jgi:hypothetical protein
MTSYLLSARLHSLTFLIAHLRVRVRVRVRLSPGFVLMNV